MKNLFIEYEPEIYKLINFWSIESDRYYISNYGNIIDTVREDILNLQNGNYVTCNLITNNGSITFSVHRLVAMAFIPKTIEDIQLNRIFVNHKNGIKTNNYYRNLEWCTHQENIIHAYKYNLKISKRGEEIHNSKLLESEVHSICKGIKQGLINSECCKLINLEINKNNLSMIQKIRRGTHWKHISILYDIDYNINSFKNPELAILICELLQDGLRNNEIVERLGVNKSLVSDIKNRRCYSNISKNYNF